MKQQTSERAGALAQRFKQANSEVIEAVERIPDGQWQTACEGEGRAVGVVAHHVAVNYAITAQVAQAIVDGQAPALTWEMLHQANAEHERQHADCTKAETLEILRRDGEQAAATISGLSDEELGRTATMPFVSDEPITTAQFVDAGVIGHISMHLPDIQSASRGL